MPSFAEPTYCPAPPPPQSAPSDIEGDSHSLFTASVIELAVLFVLLSIMMLYRKRLLFSVALSSLLLLYLAHRYIQSMVRPPLSLSHPVLSPSWGTSTFLCHQRISTLTQQPYCLHLLSLASPLSSPPCHLLLIPGTSAHSAHYHSIAHILTSTTNCSLHSIDLMGHGRSGGDRGVFTLTDWILDIQAAAEWIQREAYMAHDQHLVGKKTPLISHAPIILLGSSQGGEIAYQALRHLPQSLIPAAVSLNIFLSPRLSPSRIMSCLTHPILLPIVQSFAEMIWVPLPLFLPFSSLYSVDRLDGRRLYEEKLRDPLTQWQYSLSSYLSLFLPPDFETAPYHSLKGKWLLILCGEADPVILWKACEEAWRLLREDGEGHTDLYVWPDGVHQLLVLEGERFGKLMGSWIEGIREEIKRDWKGQRRIGLKRQWSVPEGFKASVHERTVKSGSSHEEGRSEL